jgi:hypothetical protein
MVLLVLGVPILVLFLALALERLETRLLPVREVDRSDRDELLGTGRRAGRRSLHPRSGGGGGAWT